MYEVQMPPWVYVLSLIFVLVSGAFLGASFILLYPPVDLYQQVMQGPCIKTMRP